MNFEYESRRSKSNSTSKLHQPSSTNKSGTETVKAFKEVLKMANGRKPKHIQVDEGNELIVTRFTRTLKYKMWRTFTDHNSHKYIDTLDDLIHSYNYTDHRSIHTKPALVTPDVEVWHALYDNVYGEKEKSSFKFKFNVGDIVRYRVWKAEMGNRIFFPHDYN